MQVQRSRRYAKKQNPVVADDEEPGALPQPREFVDIGVHLARQSIAPPEELADPDFHDGCGPIRPRRSLLPSPFDG